MQHVSECLSSHPQWKTFLNEAWRRKPFMFKNVLKEPLYSEKELMSGYKTAAKSVFDGTPDINFVFYYVNDGEFERLSNEQCASMVGTEPESAEDFLQRLQAQSDSKHVAAHLRYTLQTYAPSVVEASRNLVSQIFVGAGLGFPAGGWTLDCYAGAYHRTPFGIHNDGDEDQLYLTPYGLKKMCFWSPDTPESVLDQGGKDWQSIEPDFSYDVGPHDVLYFPREWYHIGQADRGMSISVQINLRTSPVAAIVGQHALRRKTLRKLMLRNKGTAVEPAVSSGVLDIEPYEALIKSECEELSRVSDEAITASSKEAFARDSIMAASSGYLTTHVNRDTEIFTMPELETTPKADERLGQSKHYPFYWVSRDDETIWLAVNGQLFDVPEEAEKVLRQILSVSLVSVNELCKNLADAVPEDLIRELVELLYQNHALVSKSE